MKNIFFVIGLAALTLTFFSCASPSISQQQQREREPEQLSIRVTSNIPDAEVTFEGAYLFQLNESTFSSVTHKTPFEIGMTSKFVSGIFRKKDGKGEIKVELLRQKGDEKDAVVSGWGNVVVLGTSNESAHNFFIQAF